MCEVEREEEEILHNNFVVEVDCGSSILNSLLLKSLPPSLLPSTAKPSKPTEQEQASMYDFMSILQACHILLPLQQHRHEVTPISMGSLVPATVLLLWNKRSQLFLDIFHIEF